MLICDQVLLNAETTEEICWDPLSDRAASSWVLADCDVLRFKKKFQSAKKSPHVL